MSRTSVLLALLLAAPSTAFAQGWGAFGGAFPLFPCQDGWVGCRVDGRAVTPDMQPDGTGNLNPANMRLGWFDLEPSTSFSPFAPLSTYTGEEPSRVAAVAAAEPVPEPVVAPSPPPAPRGPSPEELEAQRQAKAAAEEAARREKESRAAEEASRQAAAAQEAQRQAAAEAERRQKELAAQAAAAANAAEKERLQREAAEEAKRAQEAEAARKKAEEEARKAEQARIAKQKEEEEARRRAAEEQAKAEKLRQEEEARAAAEEEKRRKEEEERLAKQKAANDAAAAAAAAEAAKPPPEAGPASCDVGELVRLEPMAMLGKLSDPQISACEQSLTAAAKMTDKDKISRVLMGNAFSKGDKGVWEKLVKRHLDEIDQSDPDLCYKYALHLSKGGASRATGVIRWANVALENRTVWVGDTYTARVYSLYKLRAVAAQSLWQKAEADFAASASEDAKKKVDSYRAQTKVMAREWYEYAKVANKDHTQALQLCMSAAGTSDYCEGK